MSLISHPRLGPPGELAHGDFEMVVRRLADDMAFGTDTSRFTGSGLEYAQSRPYAPGDSIRQMDWRITARTGTPFVKEYEALKRTGVHLVIDTSASMGLASGELSKHDLAIWCAAAIGLVAQRRLSPVAVLGGGERETRFEPSLLATDLWHAIEPLRRGSVSEQTQLGERLGHLAVRARRASVIVLLSDMHDPAAMPAVRRAAQRHDVIVLELRDPAEREPLRAGFFRGREAESGAEFIGHGRQRWTRRRHADEEAAPAGDGGGGAADRSRWGRRQPQDDPEPIARLLARAGASHLQLDTDRPFIGPLRQFLAARSAAAGGRG
jgi:uncharacterized protein (DUF58 family)